MWPFVRLIKIRIGQLLSVGRGPALLGVTLVVLLWTRVEIFIWKGNADKQSEVLFRTPQI